MNPEILKLMNEGKALYDSGRVYDAISKLRQVLLVDHGNLDARSALISCYGLVGEMLMLAGILRETVDLYPSALPYTSAYLFCLNYFTTTREAVFAEHVSLMKRVESHILSPHIPKAHAFQGRKIRVGYVSGDFREHSCGYLTTPLLKLHDRNEFEIFLYSNNPDSDKKTEIYKTLGTWRDIRMVPDTEAREIVKKDGIDILVDLSGHTIAGRTSLFFHRPAPVQISWYGYLNTIGTEAIQYRITDPLLSPERKGNEQYYKEQLVRIPRSFLYEPPHDVPTVAPLPFLKNGFFTFGALHNIKKTSDYTLDLWSDVLKSVPNSKLMVSTEFGGDVESVLAKRFALRGIGHDRLIFEKDRPIERFFSFFEDIDLMLDTFPYTSGVSAMHGIWMGTPTLTMTGDTELKQNCTAVNLSRGLPEYVARDRADFIARATQLAAHPRTLEDFRKTCRNKPVVDNLSVVRSVEAVYKQLLREAL